MIHPFRKSVSGVSQRLLLLAILLLAGCQRSPQTLILNDFETPADLDRIVWRCRTTFSLSSRYRTHGKSGLLMTMYPDPYPGMSLKLTPEERDWRGYRYLALEVINPGATPVALCYRIDDQANPDYKERVNGVFRLAPGVNHLRLELAALRTSGSRRPLHWRRVDKVLFFVVSPPAKVELGVDYLRLEKFTADERH